MSFFAYHPCPIQRCCENFNLPVVLSHLDSGTTLSNAGAKLLSQCMIFPPPGEFPATLNDITYGSDEEHSVNPPDQYFYMNFKSPSACQPNMATRSHLFHTKFLLPSQQAVDAGIPTSNKPTFVNDTGGETARCWSKQPLPVLL